MCPGFLLPNKFQFECLKNPVSEVDSAAMIPKTEQFFYAAWDKKEQRAETTGGRSAAQPCWSRRGQTAPAGFFGVVFLRSEGGGNKTRTRSK